MSVSEDAGYQGTDSLGTEAEKRTSRKLVEIYARCESQNAICQC